MFTVSQSHTSTMLFSVSCYTGHIPSVLALAPGQHGLLYNVVFLVKANIPCKDYLPFKTRRNENIQHFSPTQFPLIFSISLVGWGYKALTPYYCFLPTSAMKTRLWNVLAPPAFKFDQTPNLKIKGKSR